MEKDFYKLKFNNKDIDSKFKTNDPNNIKYEKKEIKKNNIILNNTIEKELDIMGENFKDISNEEIKINRILKLREILKDNNLDKHITYDNLNNLYNLLFNNN